MKILYLSHKYDYGKIERGYSFEHYNFFDTLYNTGNEIVYFDFRQLTQKLGKEKMNQLLWSVWQQEKPDLLFAFMSENELDPKIIKKISDSQKTITINWFADDHWRFENYSQYWAASYNWVVTTDLEAVGKYEKIGYHNAILSQWGCNHFLYRPQQLPFLYDVSFVGQAYGERKKIIEKLKAEGVRVQVYGQGWNTGRLSQEEMINLFSQSRINLNLANASIKSGNRWLNLIDRKALYAPGIQRYWRKVRSNLPEFFFNSRPIYQIKGRNFEVPGCGGFLVTDYVAGLERYYELQKEIVCYQYDRDIFSKIVHYLINHDLAQAIAKAGYQRTINEHTYVHRFNQIFEAMGVSERFSLIAQKGSCKEILE